MNNSRNNELGPNTSVTIHTIVTDSKHWESVVKEDSFFDDVLLICNENKFKEYLRINKVLTIVDIYMIILLEKEQIKSIEALNSIVDKLSVKYTSTYNKPLYGEEKNKL